MSVVSPALVSAAPEISLAVQGGGASVRMVKFPGQGRVVHLDADAFFAAVEQAADPRLRGKPVAVGGERRGIIASASYEARRLGIFTPMPTSRARRLCPHLIIVPGDYEKYERFSQWMFSYAYDFTPEVEICSIDEGYFDLTGVRRSPLEVAATIRDAIRQALKISVSEGIGTSKLVSQIASKLHKPAAFESVPPGQEVSFLHPLPNQWLPGVGPRTAERLNAAGLALIQQVAVTPPDLLSLLVGRLAPQLHQFACGIDPRPVLPLSQPAKTYSQQETFAQDQTDFAYLEAVLYRMADHLFARLRADGHSMRTLTVRVRYNDMDEDQASESLVEPTDLETDVYGRISQLFRRAWRRRVSLRLVALKLSNLHRAFFRDTLLLEACDSQREARRRLADTVDQLREDHGEYVVFRGHDFVLRRGEPDSAVSARTSAHPEGRTVNGESRTESPRSALPSSVLPPSLKLRGDKPSSVPGPSAFAEASTDRRPSVLRPRSSVGVPPLVVRSHYSFLQSTLSLPALWELARHYELPVIALCDRQNLHGAVEFMTGAQAAGLRPVLGVEIQVGQQPLWLYVENARGYTRLCQLLSASNPDRGGRARTATSLGMEPEDWEDTEGLLAVSADPALASFFPGRFYRGITTRAALRRYDSRRECLPAVPVVPVYYAAAADRWKFDVVQSIRTLTLLAQPHPDKPTGGRYHFRSPRELGELFGRHPGLLEHTHELLDRCRFDPPLGRPQFPAFQPPDGSTPRAFLRQLVREGLRVRYGRTGASTRQGKRVPWERMSRQADEELEIIHAVGYEEYFLAVWDLLRACRDAGIDWITRGSAADSLVCYCLGISNACPLRFELYFRRFLNPERMALHKLPDIDIDFPHDRKDDVVELLFARYGSQHCAVVGGFSTFQSRSAFAEVAKVLGVAEREVRRFTDPFPWGFGGGWEMRPAGSTGTEVGAGEGGSETGRLLALLRSSPECRDLPLDEEPYRSALAMAEFLDGVPRYAKMHPCGVVLSRQPMHELTPTFISRKGWPTTHFDMDAVEAMGLIKMDILAQGGLAAMRDTRQALARQRHIVIDLDTFQIRSRETPAVEGSAHPEGRTANGEQRTVESRISELRSPISDLPSSVPQRTISKDGEQAGGALAGASAHPADRPVEGGILATAIAPTAFNDPAVWEMIAGGGGRAVHHIESPAMTSLCRMCQVRDIDTLIAIVSVIRPGAANEDKKREFTRRYQGLSPVTYPHASLAECLASTFGLVVYEEHILQVCEAFAGLSPGRADVLRRALVKEKWSVVREIALEFAAAARGRGRTDDAIERVWHLVTGFHGYAFCKAHSTAYGIEAYQSAWLKRYFPAEFMAAVLTHGKGFYRPLVYVLECHRLGLRLLPPWVNEPGPQFCVVQSRAIRVPIAAIQSLTESTRERVLREHTRQLFASLTDFFLRVQPLPDEMETLARVGAFDGFGQSRCEQFWEIQHLRARWGQGTLGQGWLIPPPRWSKQAPSGPTTGAVASGTPAEPSPELRVLPASLKEPSRRQRLRWEMELLGYPASGHPLELYPEVAWETYCSVSRVAEFVGQEITLCGLVIEDRVHHQATGEPMKFLTLADWTGMIETELFARTYKTYGLATVRYPVLEVTARVEPYENGHGHTLRVLYAGRPRRRGRGRSGGSTGSD